MRKSLEKTITGVYRDIAKEQIKQEGKDDVTPEEKAELETVLNWHVRNKTEEILGQKPGKKTIDKTEKNQRKIFYIQKKKQELVKRLEEERVRLNNPDYRPEKKPTERLVVCKDGQYYVAGLKQPVTIGDIITDYELGIEYYLDPDSVSKIVRKKYLFETTKRELRNLLDKQIIKDEKGYGQFAPAAPFVSKQQILKGELLDNPAAIGFVAEIVVSNFLEKLFWDFSADFQLIRTDVYEDVAHKIDFAIKRKRHYRGVKVEGRPEEAEEAHLGVNVGIQFTVSQENKKLNEKKKQIKEMRKKIGEDIELDDIVLVSLPIRNLNEVFFQWIMNGRQSGGPDKLWDMTIKYAIIEGVLQGLMTPEEIKEIKNKTK
ncbi:MAG: hypothetical protein WCT16_04695 [Candidatus Buchananbacteria bacterium]